MIDQPATDQYIILEQYKLYVEMTDNSSKRRLETNKFYISILSGLLAILSFAAGKNQLSAELQAPIIFAIALLGIGLNFLWRTNIHAYRQLNAAKFKVISDLEHKLPFACYDVEWDYLGRGEEAKKYKPISQVERYVPFFLVVPYLLLLGYSIYLFIP